MKSIKASLTSVLFELIAFGGVGAVGFYQMFDLIPNEIQVPWFIVSVFLFPIIPMVLMIEPTGKLLESDKITTTERNRLREKVRDIQFYLKFLSILFFVVGASVGIALFFANNGVLDVRLVMTVISGLLTFEMYIMAKVILYRSRLHTYATGIAERVILMKQKSKLLEQFDNKKEE